MRTPTTEKHQASDITTLLRTPTNEVMLSDSIFRLKTPQQNKNDNYFKADERLAS
jgi:hypothetical protein